MTSDGGSPMATESKLDEAGEAASGSCAGSARLRIPPDILTNPLQLSSHGCEVFRVTKDGEVEQCGQQITDDDAAVADCLREWVKVYAGIDVRPARR